MFSFKKKDESNYPKREIDFPLYVSKMNKLEIEGEVIDYIYVALKVKTVGKFIDKYIAIFNEVEKVFPYLKEPKTQEYLLAYLGKMVRDVYED